MDEACGNNVMSGAIMIEPCDFEADIGNFFIELGGYLLMYSQNILGVTTALIESRIIEAVELVTKITLETLVGFVNLKVELENKVQDKEIKVDILS